MKILQVYRWLWAHNLCLACAFIARVLLIEPETVWGVTGSILWRKGRGFMNKNQCESKRFYDTEFEAERAASIASHDFTAPMQHYRCGTHWHIGNVHKALRSRNRPYNRTYCPACKIYMRPVRWRTHVTLGGHKKREAESIDPATSW